MARAARDARRVGLGPPLFRLYAKKWWANEGNFNPENSGPATIALDPKTYQDLKDYAVLEAGRSRIVLQ